MQAGAPACTRSTKRTRHEAHRGAVPAVGGQRSQIREQSSFDERTPSGGGSRSQPRRVSRRVRRTTPPRRGSSQTKRPLVRQDKKGP